MLAFHKIFTLPFSGSPPSLTPRVDEIIVYLQEEITIMHLKSLSPLFIYCFWRKAKSPMDTNKKKNIEIFTSFQGFDRKKIKIWVLTVSRSRTGSYDLVPVTCALPEQRSLIENKQGLSYNFFLFNFLNLFLNFIMF